MIKGKIFQSIFIVFVLATLLFVLSSLTCATENEKCPSCGEMIEKGSAFCPFCGAKIREASIQKKAVRLEDILKDAQKSIFCVTAAHHRWVYHAYGKKDLVSCLLGTAFMIKPGYAMTDLSIVDKAKEIRLINHEGTSLPCQLVGKDYLYGIAVLKIENDQYHPLDIKESDYLQIGSTVYAMGYPSTKGEAKVGISIGKGIVSALEKSGVGLKQYENFIQTDVPFTDGMNGGPLLDQEGKVVGMISMFLYSKGYYRRISATVGFASPIQEMIKAADGIIQGKKIVRGWLGVILNEIGEHPDDILRKEGKGIFAEYIIPDSPADKAGLQSGDILVSMNGSDIKQIHSFQEAICTLPPSEQIQLAVKNRKGMKTIDIILDQRPEKIRLSPSDMVFWSSGLRFEKGEKKYLTISYIREGSYGHREGFKIGDRLDDILVKKDYKSDKEDYDFFNVRNWEDFNKIVKRGLSDFDFLSVLRFKEKDGRGFQKRLFLYDILQDLPSA